MTFEGKINEQSQPWGLSGKDHGTRTFSEVYTWVNTLIPYVSANRPFSLLYTCQNSVGKECSLMGKVFHIIRNCFSSMNGSNWIEGCIVVWWITPNRFDLYSFLLFGRHQHVCMDIYMNSLNPRERKTSQKKTQHNFNVPIWVKATIFCLNSFSIKILFFQIGITDEIDWHGNIQCGNQLNHMVNGHKTKITLSWIAITQKSSHMGNMRFNGIAEGWLS